MAGSRPAVTGGLEPAPWHVSCCLPPRTVPRESRRRHCRSLPMSLLGAMNTAISGLTAQSAAFGNISDNVANSQTTGYKEVETNFVDYLTTSTATVN
ncbi:MAG TPA: flagellar basal body protein, partial [Acetobacteraceae bacterium]|nr:flagellar basal body protein [Acetobacteraceae bacterium]